MLASRCFSYYVHYQAVWHKITTIASPNVSLFKLQFSGASIERQCFGMPGTRTSGETRTKPSVHQETYIESICGKHVFISSTPQVRTPSPPLENRILTEREQSYAERRARIFNETIEHWHSL